MVLRRPVASGADAGEAVRFEVRHHRRAAVHWILRAGAHHATATRAAVSTLTDATVSVVDVRTIRIIHQASR